MDQFLVGCSSCENRACINPDHLFLGTYRDKTDDMLAKGRHRFKPHRGRDNGRAKLTESRVLAIYRDERRYSDIAVDHGVSKSTVFDIKSGDSWTHITAAPAAE